MPYVNLLLLLLLVVVLVFLFIVGFYVLVVVNSLVSFVFLFVLTTCIGRSWLQQIYAGRQSLLCFDIQCVSVLCSMLLFHNE